MGKSEGRQRRGLWKPGDWAKTGTSGGLRRPPSLTLWTRRACWGNGRRLRDPAIATLSETTDRNDHHQRPGEKQQYRHSCRVHCGTSVITSSDACYVTRQTDYTPLIEQLVCHLGPQPPSLFSAVKWSALSLILLGRIAIRQDRESGNPLFRSRRPYLIGYNLESEEVRVGRVAWPTTNRLSLGGAGRT